MATISITTKLTGVSKIKGQIQGIGKSFERMGKRAQAAGRSLTRGLTLPLLAIGGASAKMAADFEKSMSEIIGLVGISQKQVDEWSKDLLKLGTALGKSPKELADGLFFITSAGLRGKKALDALTASAKASAAGLGDLNAVADAVTSAMNAYAKSNLSAEKATGILVATVKEGKLEAGALSTVLGQVIPVASALGVSFDQVGAAIAGMSTLGLNAARAVTSLNAVFTSLLKPATDAQKALKELSKKNLGVEITFKKLRTILRGPGGLLKVLTLLKQVTDGDVAAMGRLIPNVEALKGILGLVGDSADKVRQIFANLAKETGQSLVKAFEAAEKTITQKFNKALAAAKGLMIVIGTTINKQLISPLEALTGVLSGATKAFIDLSPAVKSAIVIIGGILIAIGPLLLGFALLVSGVKFVGGAFRAAFPVIRAIVAGAAVAIIFSLRAIFTAMLLVFGAGGTVIAALFGFGSTIAVVTAQVVFLMTLLAGAAVIVINSWQTLADATSAIWTRIEIIIVEAIFRIIDFILVNFGQVLPQQVTAALEAALSSVAQFLVTLRKQIGTDFADIGDVVVTTVDRVARETLGLLKNVGRQIKSAVTEPFKEMPKAANSAVSQSNQAFASMIDKLRGVTAGAQTTAAAIEGIGASAASAASAVASIGTGGGAVVSGGGGLSSAFNQGTKKKFGPFFVPGSSVATISPGGGITVGGFGRAGGTDVNRQLLSSSASLGIRVPGFQRGGSRIFTTPRLISVAETGTERVSVEPLATGRTGGGSGEINFNGPVFFDELSVTRLVRQLKRGLDREARRTV